MNSFWEMNDAQKRTILGQAAIRVGLPVESIEKDLWVTAIIQAVFSLPYAENLVFKGGTTLSKVWGRIERFSEDIDLAVDRSQFGLGGDLTIRQIKNLRKMSSLFVKDRISEDLKSVLESYDLLKWCDVEPEQDGEGEGTYPEPRKIFIKYESLFPLTASYLKPVVMLEIGARSLIEPYKCRRVSSLVTSATSIDTVVCDVDVPTAVPEKTFLEKAFLLHELFSTDAGAKANRKSRHLYDLDRMMDCDFAKKAITDDELWNIIHHHREMFTRIKDVDYTPDIRNRIVLLPQDSVRKIWEEDYAAMRKTMIYGDSKPFGDLLERMAVLQNRFRNRVG